jgi:hypothetical protein
MTLDNVRATPPSPRVHALCTGGEEPHDRDGGRPTGRLDCLDKGDDMPSATGFGDDEHTGEPRGQIGPLVQVVGHETGGSIGLPSTSRTKLCGGPDRDTDAAIASCVCSSV